MGEVLESEAEATYAEINSPPMAQEKFDMEENKCYIESTKVAPRKNATVKRTSFAWIVVIILLLVLLTLGLAGCCVAFVLEISNLKSEATNQKQNLSISQYNYSVIDSRMQQLQLSQFQWMHEITLLQKHVQWLNESLEMSYQFSTFPASSCAALPTLIPSGYYWVRTSNSSAVRMY